MSEIIKAEAISRRSAFSFFGKAAAFAMAASATALGYFGCRGTDRWHDAASGAAYRTARAARGSAHWARRST